MIQVQAIGRSDVGKVREANEDAFHVGDSVYAVADGMGGHVAGEVASHTALQPIVALDGRVFADAETATAALRDAVVAANEAVVTKAADDPSYRGMGTTLTAVMVEGRRAHVAHVGDSRAYILRDGGFSQLTTDHTLVQRLIDQGRLTREEADRHPQRSVITRAIGVDPVIDVDAMSFDLDPGDVLLLCSDGLTGPVEDDMIADLLDNEDVDEVAKGLVDAAIEAGAPDNVTVVVLRVDGLPNTEQPPAGETVQVRTRPDSGDGADWASRLGRVGRLSEDHTGGVFTADNTGRSGPGRPNRLTAIIVAVVLLLVLVLAGGRFLLSRSYYVGLDGDVVTIFQGVPASIGPVDLSWEFEATDLRRDDLPAHLVDDVEAGVPVTSAEDARILVDNWVVDDDTTG